jgi:hypothetical protein
LAQRVVNPRDDGIAFFHQRDVCPRTATISPWVAGTAKAPWQRATAGS